MKTLSIASVRSALIVAPHPDDETIGAYRLIDRLRRRGARVRVVVVADGAASHPGSAAWPKRRLVAERRRETRRVLHHIGVFAGDIRFLGLPDGAVGNAHRVPVARAIRTVFRLGLIALPDPSDAHEDHRAVVRIAGTVATPGARRLHYLVWPDRTLPRPTATHGLALGDAQAAKRGAIRRYRTQMGAVTDDPTGFTISRRELAGFSRPIELYREARR